MIIQRPWIRPISFLKEVIEDDNHHQDAASTRNGAILIIMRVVVTHLHCGLLHALLQKIHTQKKACTLALWCTSKRFIDEEKWIGTRRSMTVMNYFFCYVLPPISLPVSLNALFLPTFIHFCLQMWYFAHFSL